MQWNNSYVESVYSFANNINTHEGGSHLSGFRSALTGTLNRYGKSAGLLKDKESEKLEGEDVREGLAAVISVKLREPQFEGQTKTKLGNPWVEGLVRKAVNDGLAQFLEENPTDAKQILTKAIAARNARQAARKAREATPQERARELLAARQARRLPDQGPGVRRALPRRGQLRRRLGRRGPRPALPGDPAAARQGDQLGEEPPQQGALEPRDPGDDHRDRHRHRRRVRHREAALPPGDRDDGRRRGRLAHPHADPHLPLPADAGPRRERPRLHRRPAALPRQVRQPGALRREGEPASRSCSCASGSRTWTSPTAWARR